MGTRSGGVDQNGDVLESVKLQKELLWGDYLELLTQSRHVETVRMNAVNLVLVLTSALAALITFDRTVDLTDLVPSLIITALGIFSTIFSLAYLARYDKNKRRAEVVRKELDRRFFPRDSEGQGMTALRAQADDSTPSNWKEARSAGRYRTLVVAKKTTGTTHLFWVLLPMFVSLIGLVLTVLSVVGISAPTQ